jgi:hypothetical protein
MVLPSELPRPLPAHLPILLNAVRAGEGQTSRIVARYLVTTVRATAQSDEVRSVLDTVAVRLGDGGRVSPLSVAHGEPRPLAPLDEAERRRVADALRQWMDRDGAQQLAGPIEALRRRVRRDLDRLADYYASLDEEMRVAEGRACSPEERARRAAKRAALPEDLAARRAQIAERLRPSAGRGIGGGDADRDRGRRVHRPRPPPQPLGHGDRARARRRLGVRGSGLPGLRSRHPPALSLRRAPARAL